MKYRNWRAYRVESISCGRVVRGGGGLYERLLLQDWVISYWDNAIKGFRWWKYGSWNESGGVGGRNVVTYLPSVMDETSYQWLEVITLFNLYILFINIFHCKAVRAFVNYKLVWEEPSIKIN